MALDKPYSDTPGTTVHVPASNTAVGHLILENGVNASFGQPSVIAGEAKHMTGIHKASTVASAGFRIARVAARRNDEASR